MGLESGTKIADLNAAWPLGTDPKSQGDDHLRLIKRILQSDAWSKDTDGAPGDFVKKSGDTMTGDLRFSTENAFVRSNADGATVACSLTVSAHNGRTAAGGAYLWLHSVADGGEARLQAGTGGSAVVAGSTIELNGPVRMSGSFLDSLSYAGAGSWYLLNNNGSEIAFGRPGTIYGRVELPGVALPEDYSLVSREKGDNRYLMQTGGVIGGPLTIDAAAPYLRIYENDRASGQRAWQFGAGNSILQIVASDDDFGAGTTIFRFERDGALAAAQSVVNRASGDARYLLRAPAWNAIGSTVLCRYTGTGDLVPGDTTGGSNLLPAAVTGAAVATALSGTWVCCGQSIAGSNTSRTTNFRRIS